MLLDIILLGSVFVFLIWFWLRQKNQKNEELWKQHGIPKLRSSFLKAVLTNQKFESLDIDIYGQVKEKQAKFGILNQFFQDHYFTVDLELLKSMSIKDFDFFRDRRMLNLESADPHLHFVLPNQEGSTWKNLRSKMTPAFTTGKIRRMYPIFDSCSQNLAKFLRAQLGENGTVDFHELIPKITMDIIAQAAFGWNTNIYEDPNSEFAVMGNKVKDFFRLPVLMKLVATSVLGPKISAWLGIKLLDPQADKFFSHIVRQTLNNRIKSGEVREDFLQLMVEAKVKSEAEANPELVMTDDIIIAQSLVFFLGGFDTIESAILYSLYEIAVNPSVQEKLLEELQNIQKENDGFNYDTIQNAEYLDMVLSESLRKYPPSIRTEKRITQPYKIPDSDFVMPVDGIVIVPVYAIHHDPKLYPEPEKFDPLRFSKEEVAKRHIAAYQPFGIGPRNCIANRFALVECKAVIANLVLKFELGPCDKTDMPPKFAKSAILKPKNGMWLKVTPRD